MWWLYVPMRFDDFARRADHPGGARRLPHPQRLHPGLAGRPGRAARLAAGRDPTTRSGTRIPTGATITCTDARRQAGRRSRSSRCWPVPIHVGGGYGGDPDWGHGVWKGAGFTERRHLRHTDPAVAGRVMFGVIDHVGRAVWPRRATAPRAGASSSTAPSAATTPAASPTGSPSHPDLAGQARPVTMTSTATPSSSAATGPPRPAPTSSRSSRPHTEEVVGRVPEGTTADIDRAVAAARTRVRRGRRGRACRPRSASPSSQRVQRASTPARMMRHGRADHHRDGLADHRSRNLAQSPAPWMMLNTFIADRARTSPWEEERAGVLGAPVIVRREPVGVVAAIVPWNVPQFVDHVEAGPGAARRLHDRPQAGARDAARRLPAGRAARGGRHPEGRRQHRPRRPRGRRAPGAPPGRRQGRLHRLHRRRPHASPSICGEQLKRVSLELGGKSAAIVLDDADLAATMEGLKFAVADEQRPGLRRPDPHPRLAATSYDEVVDALAETVARHEGRRPDRPGHRDRPAGRRAPAGAGREVHRARPGGGRPRRRRRQRPCPTGFDKGWYVQPTVFADVDNRMRIAQEEIFGPVLVGHPVRRRRRRRPHRQRLRVRPGRLGVDRRRRGRASTSPAGSAPAPTASTSTRWTSSPRSAASRPRGIGREFGPEGLDALPRAASRSTSPDAGSPAGARRHASPVGASGRVSPASRGSPRPAPPLTVLSDV